MTLVMNDMLQSKDVYYNNRLAIIERVIIHLVARRAAQTTLSRYLHCYHIITRAHYCFVISLWTLEHMMPLVY
jgi:hypothetical protein